MFASNAQRLGDVAVANMNKTVLKNTFLRTQELYLQVKANICVDKGRYYGDQLSNFNANTKKLCFEVENFVSVC